MTHSLLRPILVRATLVTALFCTPALFAQRIHVVDTQGGGQFTTISAAINASNPGDVVRIRRGLYPESLDIDKGIRLVAEGAILTQSGTSPTTDITVHDVPAGQVCAIAGFAAADRASRAGDLMIQVSNCHGTVILHNLRTTAQTLVEIRIEGSGQVEVAAVELRRATVMDSKVVFNSCRFDPIVGPGFFINSSEVVCSRCSIYGGRNFRQASAVNMLNGTLALSQCSVKGHALTDPAIYATGGGVLVDPSTTLFGLGVHGNTQTSNLSFVSQTITEAVSQLNVEVHAPAEACYGILLGELTLVPTPYGDAWVDPNRFILLTTGMIPSSRTAHHSFQRPTLPVGSVFAFQTVAWNGRKLGLGAPSTWLVQY